MTIIKLCLYSFSTNHVIFLCYFYDKKVKQLTAISMLSVSSGGNPLQASADQNLPSLGDQVVSA